MSASAISAPMMRRARAAEPDRSSPRDLVRQLRHHGRPGCRRRRRAATRWRARWRAPAGRDPRHARSAASVGDESVAATAACDRGGMEERHLEQHVGRVAADARVVATHHAGEAERLRAVGNDQHALVHRDLAAVEQAQGLARARPAHHDPTVEFTQVVGMHRLPELEHHVIGDVDDRADRRRPARRSRSRIHIGACASGHTPRITRAAKRAQPAPGTSSTGNRSADTAGTAAAPAHRARAGEHRRSRATPSTPMQSPRLA